MSGIPNPTSFVIEPKNKKSDHSSSGSTDKETDEFLANTMMEEEKEK